MAENNGFDQYKLLFLERFDKLEDWLKSVDEKVDNINQKGLPGLTQEIAILKTRGNLWAGILGGAAGIIGTGIVEGLVAILVKH